MNDGLDATVYGIITAGPGWLTTPKTPKEDTLILEPNKSTLTVEFDHLENGEQTIIRNLATAIPFAARGTFTTSLVGDHTETVGEPVETLRWVKPPTDVKVGKHAATGEVSFEEHAAKKRAADATKKLLAEGNTGIRVTRWLTGDPELSGEAKGYGYDAPTFNPTDPTSPSAIFEETSETPGVNEAASEGIRSVGDLSDAIKDAAVKATEESLEQLGTMLGVDFDLGPDTIKKIIGESGISDAAAAFIAATGDPFQPYKDFASESRKKKFAEFVAKRAAKDADEQALQAAVLSPLLGLEANFADRVDALEGYLGAAPLNPEALAEARTALSAVRRTIKAAKTVHPVYATEQAAA